MKNLFELATKELSQDAFLRWLFENGFDKGCQNEVLKDVARYEAICRATRQIAEEIGATLILTGDVIQALRERVPKFDYKNGGESLCRDGFHLSSCARYVAALTWLATLTNEPVAPMPFAELDLDTITENCKLVNELAQ